MRITIEFAGIWRISIKGLLLQRCEACNIFKGRKRFCDGNSKDLFTNFPEDRVSFIFSLYKLGIAIRISSLLNIS